MVDMIIFLLQMIGVKRFNVGKYMKGVKTKKSKMMMNKDKIKDLEQEIETIEVTLREKEEEVEAKRKEVKAKVEKTEEVRYEGK